MSRVPQDYRRQPKFCSNVQDLPGDLPLKVHAAMSSVLLLDRDYDGFPTEELIEWANERMKEFGLSLRANSRLLAIALLKGVVKA